MGSIVVRDASGEVRVLPSETFKYEEVLQNHIRDIPRLIPLEAVTEEEVLHMTIGHEWPAGTGSADVVLLGSDGVITIVETKLKRNPEARREVIAQILEYAAYLSEWTIADIGRYAGDFFKTRNADDRFENKSFDEALRIFLGDTEEIETFKSAVERNLRQGRIRLIVAVDEIGEQAQKIITFVNSYSAFDLYLLQISSHTDQDGRQIFVPALYGYARKVQTTRTRIEWDWDAYRSKLGWSDGDVLFAKSMLGRLESASVIELPEHRFHKGWVGIAIGSRQPFGIQLFKTGMEVWFDLSFNPLTELPPGVTANQRSSRYLHFAGDFERLTADQLATLCSAAMQAATHKPAGA